jgi:hypothetical protein
MGYAQQNRPNLCVFTREESIRVQRYISRVGMRTAVERLRVGQITLEAARAMGRMQNKTRDRILEALAKEEVAES